MKRTQLENWSTLEKYILASHIPHSGDPNWGSVCVKTKSLYEEITSYISPDEKKPADWFTEKQCLWQYENLLKNVPRKKRRVEKAVDYGENIQDSLVQTLKQEFMSELSKRMAEDQAQYLKLIKEQEEILSGRADHKLEEMMGAIEAKEREKEIKMKLKFKIGEKNSETEIKKENDPRTVVTPPPQEPPKTVTTSPLLTSLLQSPSPLRPSMPSTASPTIALILNSSPPVPTKDSPTLTKLLESTSMGLLLSNHTPNLAAKVTPEKIEKTPEKMPEIKEKTPEKEVPEIAEPSNEDLHESIVESEIIIEELKNEVEEKINAEEQVMVTVEEIIEKVEEAIIETVGETEISLNQTIESETIEDEDIQCLELDHEAVELIVVGANQGSVPIINHDESFETNNDDSIPDEKSENIENHVKEEILEIIKEEIQEEEETPEIESEVIKLEVLEPEVSEPEVLVPEVLKPEILKVEVSEPEVSKPEILIEIDEIKIEPDDNSKSSESTEAKDDNTKDIDDEEDEEKSEEIPNEIKKEPASPEHTDTSNDISEPKSTISSNDDDKISNDDSQSQPETIAQKIIEKRQSKKRRSVSLETVKEEEESKPRETRMRAMLDAPLTPEVDEGDNKRKTRKRSSLIVIDSKPSSPSPSTVSNDDDRDYKLWKKSILLVYNRLAAHKFASVFLKPITEAEATDYHTVVLKPVDLTTIKRNIENGTIKTTVEFQRDMMLMVQNAVMYNKSDTPVHKMAQSMLEDMLGQMEIMVQALGDGVPLQRETIEKVPTRGRASKGEEQPKRKRNSTVEETPRPKRKRSDISN